MRVFLMIPPGGLFLVSEETFWKRIKVAEVANTWADNTTSHCFLCVISMPSAVVGTWLNKELL